MDRRLERRMNMIRKNWKLLTITSVIILLPMLAGVLLWNRLPEQLPRHWNVAGEIDGWMSKPMAVFGMSLLMLAVQWICMVATASDPKKAAHSEKVLHLVLWILPVLTVVMYTVTYAVALGKDVQMELIMPVLLGLMFVIIGNYLPKCKQNYTIGIKIPWTLDSEENWYKTHRFAGRLWTVCGLIIIVTGFFGGYLAVLTAALVMVFAPMIYSYLIYRKSK